MQFEGDLKITETNVEPNRAKKTTFKFLGNAMLGKFSQRSHYSETLFINSQEQIEKVFSEHEILDLLPISENICELEILPTSKCSSPSASRSGNCIIGAFVTAYARIQLHNDLMALNSRGFIPFYCDTDSIIFSDPKPCLKRPLPLSLSPCLGDYKNELGNNMCIQSFACLARKTYSIAFTDKSDQKEKISIKSSGLSLSGTLAQKSIKMQDFISLLSNWETKAMTVEVPQLRNFLIKDSSSVQHRISKHKLSNKLDVQRYVQNISSPTLPFGYNIVEK